MDIVFRRRLLEKKVLKGIMLTVGEQAIVEALSQVGFDWFFVETEHAPNLADRLNKIVLAAGEVPCLVRLSRNDEISVKRALDAGAAGIIAPRVSSAEVCEEIVRFAKFPPDGVRGIGVSRANQYGNNIESYLSDANGGVSVVIQIEDKAGVDNLENILEVAGLDSVFVGPYDLSASIGRTGDLKHPEVQALIDQVRKKCLEVDKPVGIFEPDIEAARQRIEQGFSLITISTDISCIIRQTKTILQSI